MVEEIVSRIQDILPTTTPVTSTQNKVQMQEIANAAITNANTTTGSTPQLIQQMQAIQSIMLQMQQNMCQPTNPRLGMGGRLPTGPRPGQPSRPLPASSNKYCGTHGRCAHVGQSCNNRAPGHKAEATETNRIGGSEWGVL